MPFGDEFEEHKYYPPCVGTCVNRTTTGRYESHIDTVLHNWLDTIQTVVSSH